MVLPPLRLLTAWLGLGVAGEVLPQAPHGAHHRPALVTPARHHVLTKHSFHFLDLICYLPVMPLPRPRLGADVGAERLKVLEWLGAVVAAQRQLLLLIMGLC